MYNLVNKMRHALQTAADEKEALIMTKYMRNNFAFYGVRMPKVKAIVKEYWPNASNFSDLNTFIRLAWQCPEREFQYAAMYAMHSSRTLWTQHNRSEDIDSLLAFIISNKSWWDTVDFIASSLVFEWWKCDPDLVDQVINTY